MERRSRLQSSSLARNRLCEIRQLFRNLYLISHITKGLAALAWSVPFLCEKAMSATTNRLTSSRTAIGNLLFVTLSRVRVLATLYGFVMGRLPLVPLPLLRLGLIGTCPLM